MSGLNFFVPGVPASKGSKSMIRTKTGRYIMIEANANKLKKWMHAIEQRASLAFKEPIEGAVHLECRFYFQRPKSVKKRLLPHVKPDLDKLLRAVDDALQGIAFKDDSQVTTIIAHKYYVTDNNQGVLIGVFSDEKKKETV
jgi:crossover junction endodeoxyribonuclease RusA